MFAQNQFLYNKNEPDDCFRSSGSYFIWLYSHPGIITTQYSSILQFQPGMVALGLGAYALHGAPNQGVARQLGKLGEILGFCFQSVDMFGVYLMPLSHVM